jgi:hypothetical protein
VVAVRSLPRRFRALFAGLGDDESPDALARRTVADGSTPLGHVGAATRVLALGGRGLAALLATEGASVEPVTVGALTAASPTGSLEEGLAELGWEADALADRAEHLGLDDWGRSGSVAGTGASISAADLFWQAVDAAVDQLKAAERTLAEARRAS